jgi:hypothetical protein
LHPGFFGPFAAGMSDRCIVRELIEILEEMSEIENLKRGQTGWYSPPPSDSFRFQEKNPSAYSFAIAVSMIC